MLNLICSIFVKSHLKKRNKQPSNTLKFDGYMNQKQK